LSFAGAAIGALGSWAVSRFLGSLVPGSPASNLLTLAAATLTVIGIATIAAALPVWRATQVDAMDKLHRA